MPQLLEELRLATARAHQDLHGHPALRELVSDELTPDYYGNALKGFYGFYKPYESLYAESQHELLATFPPTEPLQWLADDLRRLGIDPDSVPVHQADETHFDHEQALAWLYLREGSKLGGKVITRHLEAQLGLRPGVDNRFFWSNGDEVGEQWRALREQFAAYPARTDIETDINKTSRYAGILFERLHTWMTHG